MLVLSDRDVLSLLTSLSATNCRRILDALSKALVDYSSSRDASHPVVHQPQRQVFTTNLGHTSLFMPASNTDSTGIKIVTIPGNGGAPRGSINIFAPEGDLIGLLNAEEITAFRTALATMVPFLKCPLPKGRVVIFGAGKQAEWHIRLALLLAGDSIQSITVISRRSSTLDQLLQRLSFLREKHPGLGLRSIAKDKVSDYQNQMQAALRECDAIMCCTPSTSPLFPASYLSKHDKATYVGDRHRFISLIGSYRLDMQEIDTETLLTGLVGQGYIYVDSKSACLEEAGEIIKAKVTEDQLVELGKMLSRPELLPKDGTTVFKCVGMGIMDVAVGSEIVKIAREMGVGREIEDF